MSLVIGLLTFVLIVTSLLLMLLILVQLPKKEAGAGLAFGGATSDALFGAGSGNVLTKLTKYASGIFLALSLTLSILHNHRARAGGHGVLSEVEKRAAAAATVPRPAAAPAVPLGTNPALPLLQVTSKGATSNLPIVLTNATAVPAK